MASVLSVNFLLMGLSYCGRAFECDDELLKLRLLAKTLQIVVGFQSIGIFISAVHGLL